MTAMFIHKSFPGVTSLNFSFIHSLCVWRETPCKLNLSSFCKQRYLKSCFSYLLQAPEPADIKKSSQYPSSLLLPCNSLLKFSQIQSYYKFKAVVTKPFLFTFSLVYLSIFWKKTLWKIIISLPSIALLDISACRSHFVLSRIFLDHWTADGTICRYYIWKFSYSSTSFVYWIFLYWVLSLKENKKVGKSASLCLTW